MAQSEKELEKQLLDAGNAILSSPPSASDLLPLLDRVENSLARVEQSPSDSMRKALAPSRKALIADGLLKHSDVDVKVSVASCISEITRITAPDAPYEDDEMKEVFKLIVSSFEQLDDKSSPSYIKRTSILETVAKVRSCVVMLDLECDDLIGEMFQHFFRSIRDDHPENVFSSMETIMTLVLEESEDIPLDLLSSILDHLKTENKEVLQVARQLAEKVVEKCASKLKPYLLPAVKAKGGSLDDYSKVVASVCHTGSEAVEPSDGDAASKNLVDENDLAKNSPEKAVEVPMETLEDAPPNEEVGGPTSVGSPKSVMSNGTLQKEVEDSSAGNNHSNEAIHDNDQAKTDAEPKKIESESLGAEEPAKAQSKPEKSKQRKGRKTSALKGVSEPAESSLEDLKKKDIKVPELQEKDSKESESAKSEDPVTDTGAPKENKEEAEAPVSSQKTSENVRADVPSPSCSESLADEIRSKKVGRGKKKDDSVQDKETKAVTESKKETDVKSTSEETGIPEPKSNKRSAKKVSLKEDKVLDSADVSVKEDDKSELETKSGKKSGKKAEAGSQREDKKNKGQSKETPAKDITKTPSKGATKKPPPKSSGKSTKDESDVEKTPKASSKRKRSPSEEKASKTKGYGSELVGSKVKVWWPDDKKFYKGVVGSFDPADRTHMVLYDDGDVETLELEKERWKLIDGGSAADEGHSSDSEGPQESAEMPKGKKAKTSVDKGSKQGGKTGSSAKKGSASSNKSKTTPKSKVASKSKADSSKSAGKAEDKVGKSKDTKSGSKPSEVSKSVGKSKDDDTDTSKGGNKSKLDTPKSSASKSKVKSAKSGSKSKTNGLGKLKASLLEDDDEDEDMSPEPTKSPEPAKGNSSKSQKSSGKKRKRSGKS